MKVKICYEIDVNKEIEMTPEEYCNLRANHSSRPDIFPENCRHPTTSIDEKEKQELEEYLYDKEQKKINEIKDTIEALTKIKEICKSAHGCDNCPFYSDRIDECILQYDSPFDWIITNDGRLIHKK